MRYKPRKYYTEAFKIEAVRRSLETYGSQRELAVELGIHPSLLNRWRRFYLIDNHKEISILEKTKPPEKGLKEIEAENKRLKKALVKAQTEVEILKKAQRYFKVQRQNDSSS